MKKFFSIFAFIAVAAMALTSCSKENDIDPVNENGVKMKTITVRTGIATKTTLDSDHSNLVWSTDDKISLFNNASTDNAELTYQAGGDITVSVPAATTEIYAHYPYFNGNTSGPSNVSVYINKNQTQKNPGELNGYYYPMVAKGTVSDDNKALISFYPVASALALNIYKTELSETETVKSVKVTPSSENTGFIGRQYMNLAGESLKYNNADASDAITVTLTNPLTLSNTKPTNSQTFDGQVYVCLAKQSYKNVKFEITTSAGIYTITSNATPFDCVNKDFIPININLSNVNADFGSVFEESFATDEGTFSIEGTSGIWTHASYNGDNYMKATSYISGHNTAATSWLISPSLDIQSNKAVLSFNQAVNDYFGTVSNEATVWIRVKNGGTWGSWTQLTGFDYPTISGSGHFSKFEGVAIDLGSYKDKTVQIGFKYIGTTDAAGTWEIKDFKVTYASSDVVPAPVINVTSSTSINVTSDASTNNAISYNISNPVSGVSLTATPSVSWINNISVSSGQVTFNVDANTDGTRSGVITLSYNGAADVEVTVNQAAYISANTLWAEGFSGFSANSVPSASNDQTVVYGGSAVTYVCTNSGTKIYNENRAGGIAPELLIAKSNGTFTVNGIPTNNATGMTLTFRANYDYVVTSSSSSGVAIKQSTYNSTEHLYTVIISAPSSLSSMSLTFTNTNTSNNVRVDDFSLEIGAPAFMEATIDNTSINYQGGNLTLTIESTVDWTVSATNGATLKIGNGTAATSVNGSNDETITVIIPQNNNGATYGISFSSTNTSVTLPDGITITQTAKPSGSSVTTSFIFNTDAGLSALGITKPDSGKGTELGSKSYTSNGVSLTATNGGTATRVWNSQGNIDLRVYKNGGSLTLSVASGSNIKSIVLSGNSVNGFTANVGTFTSGTWTGAANSVTLSATATANINVITVTYE